MKPTSYDQLEPMFSIEFLEWFTVEGRVLKNIVWIYKYYGRFDVRTGTEEISVKNKNIGYDAISLETASNYTSHGRLRFGTNNHFRKYRAIVSRTRSNQHVHPADYQTIANLLRTSQGSRRPILCVFEKLFFIVQSHTKTPNVKKTRECV